ncbi:hypothetical protein GCM10009731_35950 [Streptomyces globosus]
MRPGPYSPHPPQGLCRLSSRAHQESHRHTPKGDRQVAHSGSDGSSGAGAGRGSSGMPARLARHSQERLPRQLPPRRTEWTIRWWPHSAHR